MSADKIIISRTTPPFFPACLNPCYDYDSRRSSLPAKLLPQLLLRILGYHGSEETAELRQAIAKGATLRDYQFNGKLQRFQSAATSLKFEPSDRTYLLTEQARGDFDGDGFEDSLVVVSWRYREGTGLGAQIILVQRVQNKPLTPFSPSCSADLVRVGSVPFASIRAIDLARLDALYT